MLILYLLGAALSGVGIGLLVGRSRWRRALDYPAMRLGAIGMVADQLPKGGTLLLGDSLLEHCHFDEPDIINAGASFATIAHVAAVAPRLIATVRPKTTLLCIGPNDLQRGEADFERRYADLVGLCDSPRLILVGIPNQPEASVFIAGLADRLGAAYIPPIFGDGLTVDRMGHQTAAGGEAFRQRIRHAVAEAGAAAIPAPAALSRSRPVEWEYRQEAEHRG